MSYYKPLKELERIKALKDELPPLEDHHYEILKDLDLKNNEAMYKNCNIFLLNEILRYNKEIKVFRTSHMGETRGGKSKGAQLLAFIDVYIYNTLYEKGHFDKVDVNITKKPIELEVKNVHRNQSFYHSWVKDEIKENALIYGTRSIIDEDEPEAGGLGSATAQIERTNYNNIVAKYNLGEHYITPHRFIDMNTSYGFHWFIKDVKNKLNWALLYRISAWSKGISPQSFLGWVCFPLHENKVFDEAYEIKKNLWIDEVLKGGGDVRTLMRMKAAEELANNSMFSLMKTEKSFVLTNDQQTDIIDEMIAKGEIPNFNAQERQRICDRARLIVKMERYPEKYKTNAQISE